MKSIRNFVQLLGNLGKDAETRTLDSGKGMITFYMATSESWINDAGQKVEKTEWHNVIIYRKNLDIANKLAQYLTKGTRLAIQGNLSTKQSKQDVNGTQVTHYNTSVIADELVFLNGKRAGQAEGAVEPE